MGKIEFDPENYYPSTVKHDTLIWTILVKWTARFACGAWFGGSAYFLWQLNAECFQAFGSVGVGAMFAQYAFIRGTFSARRDIWNRTYATAMIGVFNAGRQDGDVAESLRSKQKEVVGEIDAIDRDEQRSVFTEVVFVIIATLQWGFGNKLVELL